LELKNAKKAKAEAENPLERLTQRKGNAQIDNILAATEAKVVLAKNLTAEKTISLFEA